MIGPLLSGHNFNRRTVLKVAPKKSGVFALYSLDRWVYVGNAANIQAALLAHMDGADPCTYCAVPTRFQFEIVSPGQRVRRQEELIQLLGPKCNLGLI